MKAQHAGARNGASKRETKVEKVLTYYRAVASNNRTTTARKNFLPVIVIAQNSFDSSITDIAFVIYFVIADKLSR